MGSLRCIVFRGLPKELEEEVNKFLETTPCRIERMTQSESDTHISLTILYALDPAAAASVISLGAGPEPEDES